MQYILFGYGEWLRNENQLERKLRKIRLQECFALAHLEFKQPTRHVRHNGASAEHPGP